MVPIGNIQTLHLRECLYPGLCLRDPPDRMLYPVAGTKVVQRFAGRRLARKPLDGFCTPVGKQDQPGLSSKSEKMSSSVFHLVRPRVFMLFYQALFVFVERTA